MEQKRADLRIQGVSRAPGGHYRSVTIDGVSKVEGPVRSDGPFVMNGTVRVFGDVRTEELNVNGQLKIKGRLSFGTSQIDGYLKVDGSVDGERLALHGLLKAGGDCEAERFEGEGGFDIGGLLNAGTLDVRLYAGGKAREIGGDVIRVRRTARSVWKKMWLWMVPKRHLELKADLIEGDEVDLENTIASVVRGNRVVVGPGCRIGRVEYRSELIKRPGARIEEEVKFGDGNRLA
jgi:cytoskeletal protein CcmA (bactofilin family)